MSNYVTFVIIVGDIKCLILQKFVGVIHTKTTIFNSEEDIENCGSLETKVSIQQLLLLTKHACRKVLRNIESASIKINKIKEFNNIAFTSQHDLLKQPKMCKFIQRHEITKINHMKVTST